MCFSVFAHGCAHRALASTTLLVVAAAPQLSAQDTDGNPAAQPVLPSTLPPRPRAGLMTATIARVDVIRRQLVEVPFAP